MHRPRPTLSWLFAIALVAGQWLFTAHASQHWQPEQAKAHLCALCAHHAGEQALTGSSPVLAARVAGYVLPRAAHVASALRGAPHPYEARGPPVVLA